MSEKTPARFQNNDLLLPSLTDSQRKIDINNYIGSILKKRQSSSQNDNFVYPQSSYLLPPLYSPFFLDSYTLQKKKRIGPIEQNLNQAKQENTNALVPLANRLLPGRDVSSIKQNQVTFFYEKGILSLRYELRSLTPYTRSQVEAQKKHYARASDFSKKEKDRLKEMWKDKAEQRTNFLLSVKGLTICRPMVPKRSFTNSSQWHVFLTRVRNFVDPSFNALLGFAPLFVNKKYAKQAKSKQAKNTKRSAFALSTFYHVKTWQTTSLNHLGLPEPDSKTLHKRFGFFMPSSFNFCAPVSRGFLLPTINLILLTVLAMAQRSHQNKVFFARSEKPFYVTLCESKIPNATSSSLSGTGTCQSVTKVPLLYAAQMFCKSFAWVGDNSNNAFSVSKQNNVLLCLPDNWSVSDKSTINGFQYYLPFYTTLNRIFAENDTIPSKRSHLFDSKISNVSGSYKPVARQDVGTMFRYATLCTDASQFILKRFFYKYGWLVVSPSKKTKESQDLKETEKYSRSKSVYTTQMSSRSILSEPENGTNNQFQEIKPSKVQKKTNDRPGRVKLRSTFPNSVQLALHKNIETSQPYSSKVETRYPRTQLCKKESLNQVEQSDISTSAKKSKPFFTLLKIVECRTPFMPAYRWDYEPILFQQNVEQRFLFLHQWHANKKLGTLCKTKLLHTFCKQKVVQNFVLQSKQKVCINELSYPFAFAQTRVKNLVQTKPTWFSVQEHNFYKTFSLKLNDTPVHSTNKKRLGLTNPLPKRGIDNVNSPMGNKTKSTGFNSLHWLPTFLPMINQAEFNRYSFVLNDFNHYHRFPKKENTGKRLDLFPLGLVWSRFDLSGLHFDAFPSTQRYLPAFLCDRKIYKKDHKISNRHAEQSTTFVQRPQVETHDGLSTFCFVPDGLAPTHSLSGYLFPELEEREMVSFFRKKVFFTGWFHTLTTPFRTFTITDVISKVVPTSFLIRSLPHQKDCMFLQRSLVSANLLHQPSNLESTCKSGLTTPSKILPIKNIPNTYKKPSVLLNRFVQTFDKADQTVSSKHVPSFVDDVPMRYAHVGLDEIQNVKAIFKKLGKKYEDYADQPKDSLPALIISPSLEDDREIEEEGIRIFRKRDFVINPKQNVADKNHEPNQSVLLLSSMAPNASENKKISDRPASKSEEQNHQLLVKNALRQAQEEIDTMAKKEEKGTEKDEQVIPPLTRLEALYTIRHREKRHELAKDLISKETIVSRLSLNNGLNKAKRLCTKKNQVFFSSTGTFKPNDNPKLANVSFNFCTYAPVYVQSSVLKNTSLPVFEELFLHSDKINPTDFSSIFTPWIFSKLGDQNLFTDRKHSFWGEMSLPLKKLTAQEQKQVFQQKSNPLVREKTKSTNFRLNEWQENVTNGKSESCALNISPHFSVSNALRLGYHKLDWSTASATLPKSLLSPFSVLVDSHYKKNEPLKFKVGSAESQKKSLVSKNRVYFYDKLSQNKACQGSAPKTKGTPLQSPVLHRVWQPKRMEPSTFRVLPRDRSAPVIPKISQKDWSNIIEWQLKKHFVEENKRLLPLSLNQHKTLKIKKVNLYLPWIAIKKRGDFFNDQEQAFSITEDSKTFHSGVAFESASSAWPLTRLDFTGGKISEGTPNLGLQQKRWYFLHSENDTSFCHVFTNQSIGNHKTDRYWRLPIQKNIYTSNLSTKRVTNTNRNVDPHLHFKSIDHKLKKNQKRPNQRTFGLISLTVSDRDRKVLPPKTKSGIGKKVFNELILFERVTKYSWLFIYTFVSLLIFKQIVTLVYTVGLKDFFIKFLNSEFGRTITSEEFRYSIQNTPLAEFYRPQSKLTGLLGLEKNKVQLLEIVWFLRNHCQGRNGPRGVLLIGPPGVESVSVVQAIAGQAGVPIVVQSLEKIAGDNEPQRQLEQLYMRAHKKAPCVLFLDKLDTIGTRRDQMLSDTVRRGDRRVAKRSFASFHNGIHNAMTYDAFQPSQGYVGTENDTLNGNSVTAGNKLNVVLRLLTILDGVTQSNGVVTVATAQDLTKLDPALLRPKRFDRKIYLSLPNQQDRVHLLKVETQSIGHSKDMPWDYLSLQTESMSSVDIRSAINYSLFKAVLKNSAHTVQTLKYGVDCVKTLTSKRSITTKRLHDPYKRLFTR